MNVGCMQVQSAPITCSCHARARVCYAERRASCHRLYDLSTFAGLCAVVWQILFKEAVTVLMKKVIGIAGLLNDAVAGISSSSVTGV